MDEDKKVGSTSVSALAARVLLSLLLLKLMSVFIFLAMIIIFSAGNAANMSIGSIVAQILTLILLFAFLYSEFWRAGERDRSGEAFGHIKKDPRKGLKSGLIGMLPFYASAVLFVIFKIAGSSAFLVFYKYINAEFFPFFYFTLPAGTAIGKISTVSVIISILPLFLAPAICFGSYAVGHRGYSVREHLVYKKRG